MIVTEKGRTILYGEKAEIMADLTVIITTMHENKNISKEEIMKVVDRAFKTEDEIEKEFHDMTQEILEKILGRGI